MKDKLDVKGKLSMKDKLDVKDKLIAPLREKITALYESQKIKEQAEGSRTPEGVRCFDR